jgi:hypothetical protein
MIISAALSAQAEQLHRQAEIRKGVGSTTPDHWQADDDDYGDDSELDGDEKDDRADAELDKSRRLLPGPADSPGHDVPVDGGPFPRQLAARGGRVRQGEGLHHVDLHDCAPKPLAYLVTVGDPLGSLYNENPGKVSLDRLDHAGAASNGPLPGTPSGDPSVVAPRNYQTAPRRSFPPG